jgi:alkylation response protein AidB-like acyl-CoA dehydrogenase
VGEVGAYISQGFQSFFTPHYAASFLGAAEGAFDYALEYVKSQGKQMDPYVQHHVARISMNIETLELWLERVAAKLSGEDIAGARIDGSKVRYLAEQLAEDSVKRCIKICGARSLNKPSRLEKIYRDLSMYVLHDNADHVLATIGRGVLDVPADESFFNLKA